MGNCLSALHNVCANDNNHFEPHSASNPLTTTTTITTPLSNTPSSSSPRYTVFISHAGEDKATIAIPLRQKLLEHGISAFVDETDMPLGTQAPRAMIDAMETANVAVIVLSPEFVARKWPMRELMCFLRRRKECMTDDTITPIVIPFFYRLSVGELYDEPRLDRKDKDGNLLYHKSRFYERQQNDEPEANIAHIKEALESVHEIMGLRNDLEASNDPSYIMSKRRDMLLVELCNKIREAVPRGKVKRSETGRRRRAKRDTFEAHFDVPYEIRELVFDFESKDNNDNALTQEGKVLGMLMDRSKNRNRSIGVRGIGGVGKTSLLKGLRSLKKVRRRFRDGVYNLPLGMHATRGVLIEELCMAVQRSGGNEMADVMRSESDIRKVIEIFLSWFAKRQCLFVIDDVWKTKEITSEIIHELVELHISGRDSKVLLMTRSVEIASRGDTCFTLKPRKSLEKESRRILFGYSRMEPAEDRDEDQKVVNEILERCCGLPLFLAVAGKGVRTLCFREGVEGCGAYHMYAEKLESSMASLLTTDVRSYEGLSARLKISIELVEKRKKDFGFETKVGVGEMHRRLSVMTKQARLPMSMLKHLWEVESTREAADVSKEFEQVGLADIEVERRETGPVEVVRVHDSVHEFCVIEARKHDEEKSGHEAVLRGYGHCVMLRNGCHEWWHSFIDGDRYIHANVCRHLLCAGRSMELLYLLVSPEWTERQIKNLGILFLESDFSVGMRVVQGEMRDTTDDDFRTLKEAICLISDVVNLSSGFISSNGFELSFQLQGRLQSYCESNRAIREYVSGVVRNAEKPFIVCKTSFLGEPSAANTRIVPLGSRVSCMVIMNDGERFACGLWNGDIALVNVKRSEIENRWKAHDYNVTAMTITSDGKRLVSGSWDRTAKVWEVESGDLVTSFPDHSNWVNDVALMNDERRVISVSLDGTARIWNLESGEIVSKPFVIHDSRIIRCVTVLEEEEEDIVVTGGDDNKVRMWNVMNGAQLGNTFDGHDDLIDCVTVTPDGEHIVSGSNDKTVRVWDVKSREQVGSSFTGHTSDVICVAVSEDGCRIASGSWDRTIRIWDMESQKEICDPLEGHADDVNGVSFLGDDNDVIVSCSWDGTVRMWDLTRKNKKRLTGRHKDIVSSVQFSPDGRVVVSGSYDNTIHTWDATSGQQVGDALEGHSHVVSDVAVTPNGRFVVSVSWDETVGVWELESRKLLHTFTGHTDVILCVAVTPQGDRFVTGSYDKSVRIWDLEAMDGSHVVLEGHSYDVTRVFVSDDGMRAVSVDEMDNIFIWELETKKLVRQFKKEETWRLSRREVLTLIGETTVHDDTTLSIQLKGREIFYGEGPNKRILATLECNILSWALSPEKETICVGLRNGQVELLKLER